MRKLFNTLAYPVYALIHKIEESKHQALNTQETTLREYGYIEYPHPVWPLSKFHACNKKEYPQGSYIRTLEAIRREKWRIAMRSVDRHIRYSNLKHFMPQPA